LSGSEKVNKENLHSAFSKFVPSVDTDEKRLQLLAAVLECTDMNFLPREFQKEITTGSRYIAPVSDLEAVTGTVLGNGIYGYWNMSFSENRIEGENRITGGKIWQRSLE